MTLERLCSAPADVTAGVFDLLMDQLGALAESGMPGQPPLANGDRLAIAVVRRANGKQSGPVLMSAGVEQGAWQLRVRHRSGSLEAVVAQNTTGMSAKNLARALSSMGSAWALATPNAAPVALPSR